MKQFLFCVIMMFILGCSNSSVDNKGGEYIYEYQLSSQKAALFYSGEFYPPDELSEKIDNDLRRIARVWPDETEEYKQFYFETPWYVSGFHCGIDSTTFESILDSTNTDWLNIANEYDLRVMFWLKSLTSNDYYASIRSSHLVHPVHLAQKFVEFPGFQYVQTSSMPLPIFSNFLISFEGTTRKYFFYNITYYDIFHNYSYFEIDNGKIFYHGFHSEHQVDFYETYWDEIPVDSFLILDKYIIDSLEANKPAWVDTAKVLKHNLEFYGGYIWNKPE